jgi:hypothetical protein
MKTLFISFFLALPCAAQSFPPAESSESHYETVIATAEQAQDAEITGGVNAMNQTYTWQRLPTPHCDIIVQQIRKDGAVCNYEKLVHDFDTAEDVPRHVEFIFVKNYPRKLAVGMPLTIFTARLIGYTNIMNRPAPIFDCALPILTPDQIAVEKKASEQAKEIAEKKKREAIAMALKSNMDAAAKGDAYGLMRMGERYRDGDGVPKDAVKARDYLQRAADAGSPTASEELKRL